MASDLELHIEKLERDEAIASVNQRLAGDGDPVAILADCRAGMTNVGELFQQGDYYLAELLLSAEIFKEAVKILEPHLIGSQQGAARGKIILATMRGDIHDLGKNIVATLLRVQSFEVYDLGVNVEPAELVEKVKEVQPDFVGLSALITTSFDSAKEAADLLVEKGLRQGLKILVGGGVTTPTFRDYIGADFQTLDATAGVDYCIESMRVAV